MTMLELHNDQLHSIPRSGMHPAQPKPAGYPWLRRLLWVLAGGGLVLGALLAPALVEREVVWPPPPAATRAEQTGADHPAASTSHPAPVLATPAPPASARMRPAASTGALHAAAGATGAPLPRLFLPLVARVEQPPVLNGAGPVALQTRQVAMAASPGSAQVVAPAGVLAAAPPASNVADNQLLLAAVLSAGNGATLPNFRGGQASALTAEAGVGAGPASQALAGAALYLPLVVNPSRQVAPVSSAGSQPAATSTPSTIPAVTPGGSPPTPAMPTPAAPLLDLPALHPPIAALEQSQLAQQQLQALLDQVNQLIERGALPAAQGQPLREQISALTHLPIFMLGGAPANPNPGQPRPWQRLMQRISDEIDRLVASGALPSDQAQPLRDQVRAIMRTLRGE